MLQSRFYSISLWTSLVVLVAFSGFAIAWPINQWSATYLGQRLGSPLERSTLPAPPDEHLHAGIWLAEEALAAGEYGDATLLLQSLVDEDNLLALHMWGILSIQQGNYNDAIDVWVKARDYIALNHFKQIPINSGNLELAKDVYEGLLKVQPEKIIWPFAEFLAYHMNNYFAAESLLRESIQQYPESLNRVEWMYRLGQLYSEEKRWDEAIQAYEDVLSISPKHYWALVSLGNITHNRGDGLEQSALWFQIAIEVDPNQGDAYFYLARTFTREQRFQEGEIWYIKAIDLEPNMHSWWLAWANNARAMGDYTLAEQRYLEILSQFPKSGSVYVERASNYKLWGDKDKASENMDKALSLMESPDIWYFLQAGNIYEWADNINKALEAYQNLITIDPNNIAALNAIQRLGSEHHDD